MIGFVRHKFDMKQINGPSAQVHDLIKFTNWYRSLQPQVQQHKFSTTSATTP
jgi:hypothetical protein